MLRTGLLSWNWNAISWKKTECSDPSSRLNLSSVTLSISLMMSREFVGSYGPVLGAFVRGASGCSWQASQKIVFCERRRGQKQSSSSPPKTWQLKLQPMSLMRCFGLKKISGESACSSSGFFVVPCFALPCNWKILVESWFYLIQLPPFAGKHAETWTQLPGLRGFLQAQVVWSSANSMTCHRHPVILSAALCRFSPRSSIRTAPLRCESGWGGRISWFRDPVWNGKVSNSFTLQLKKTQEIRERSLPWFNQFLGLNDCDDGDDEAAC